MRWYDRVLISNWFRRGILLVLVIEAFVVYEWDALFPFAIGMLAELELDRAPFYERKQR